MRLIHHSVLRRDDLVNKVYEAIRSSKQGDEDQKPAADQQQQQLPAEAAAQGANVTKRLLTHFLIYVGNIGLPNTPWTCFLQIKHALSQAHASCRWQTSRSRAYGCARSHGCRNMGLQWSFPATCSQQALLPVSVDMGLPATAVEALQGLDRTAAAVATSVPQDDCNCVSVHADTCMQRLCCNVQPRPRPPAASQPISMTASAEHT